MLFLGLDLLLHMNIRSMKYRKLRLSAHIVNTLCATGFTGDQKTQHTLASHSCAVFLHISKWDKIKHDLLISVWIIFAWWNGLYKHCHYTKSSQSNVCSGEAHITGTSLSVWIYECSFFLYHYYCFNTVLYVDIPWKKYKQCSGPKGKQQAKATYVINACILKQI